MIDVLKRFDEKLAKKDRELDKRCKKLPVLTSREVKWEGTEEGKDGIVGHPVYDDETKAWVKALADLDLMDKNYSWGGLIRERLEKLTRDQVLSQMTWIVRIEKISKGYIASNLENGNIEKLGKRLKEAASDKWWV